MTCVVCKHTETYDFFSIKNFPIYMGAVKSHNFEFSDLIFAYCENCFLPQIRHKIDASKLYFKNHNVDSVGKIWQEHYESFSAFCLHQFLDKEILEIGDPSAKLAKKLHSHVKNWDIIEPNPSLQDFANVTFINAFFTNPTSKKYDCIVSSHVFEHVNPIEHLNFCYDSLNDDGMIFISIPDMNFFLQNFINPVLILHFEHTHYLDERIVEYLLEVSGFEKCQVVYFQNHSLFISARKITQKNKVIINNYAILQKFQSMISNFELYVNSLKNKDLSNSYIYGCHVTSQCLLSMGIVCEKLLDNSKSKNGLYLYGTNLQSEIPDIIQNVNNPKIITSHAGIYRREIEKQLLEINPSCILC